MQRLRGRLLLATALALPSVLLPLVLAVERVEIEVGGLEHAVPAAAGREERQARR